MLNKTSKRKLTIKNIEISDESECFVIAEIGHNHQGKLDICKQLFKEAKACGVNAVKLQKRHNKKLYTKDYYNLPYNSENAYGPTYGLHREALEFGLKEYRELKRYAEKLGLILFATPFDVESVDFLESLDMPCYKIASGDLLNIPLIKYVASLGKPMLVSTGGGKFLDVKRVYDAIVNINSNLAFLQCTATYPSQYHELNLQVIKSFRKKFPNQVIGLSSHDNGIAMALASYILGGRIVEKHFTLNRAMKGTDHAYSLEPIGMRKLVRDLRRARMALGDGIKKHYESEKPAIIKMGKKIVAARDLRKGHVIDKKDLVLKSPGNGIFPNKIELFYGKKLKTDLKEDEDIKLEYIK